MEAGLQPPSLFHQFDTDAYDAVDFVWLALPSPG